MARGAFILFEGGDRTGKTTQARRTVAALVAAGIPTHPPSPLRFPDRTTPTGGLLSAALSPDAGGAPPPARALHLLFSANRWEAAAGLTAALAAGETVIADRYALSGVAYTLAAAAEAADAAAAAAAGGGGPPPPPTAGGGRLPPPDARWALAADAGLPAPDLIVQLTVGGGAAARPGWGAERYETAAMQARVADVFDALRGGGLDGVRVGGWGGWARLDGTGSVDAVGERVMGAVLPAVARVRREDPPLGQLWGAE